MDIGMDNAESMPVDVPDPGKDELEIEPTQEESNTLERIADCIPWASWLIVMCEACERFAFYGITGPFQNYIQFPVPGPNGTQAGALDRGQQTATLLTTFFQFFCYLTPIAGGIIADQFWGKYRTLTAACLIYIVGLLVLVLTSIPPAIHAGVALPGLIVTMIILGVATGGVKSNVSPFMAEQYTRTKPVVRGKAIDALKEKIDPLSFQKSGAERRSSIRRCSLILLFCTLIYVSPFQNHSIPLQLVLLGNQSWSIVIVDHDQRRKVSFILVGLSHSSSCLQRVSHRSFRWPSPFPPNTAQRLVASSCMSRD